MVWKDPEALDPYEYHEGFGNHIVAEAVPGVIPQRGNNPQEASYGLYTEQLSGTAFTADREHNQRTWLYKIRPSVEHLPFKPRVQPYLISHFHLPNPELSPTPTQLRWDPFSIPSCPGEWEEKQDFVKSLRTICGSGEPQTKCGLAIHVYGFNTKMQNKAFWNSDGDMLILPQQGILDVVTEFGKLWVPPGQIAVIPRGIKFAVNQDEDDPDYETGARGYVLETFSALHFTLPYLGPIGANGLANPKDFRYPMPWYEDPEDDIAYLLVNKFMGTVYDAKQPFSPFDVVGYHGNYLPYKYDLSLFCPVGALSFDHMDPSIFTVLSVPNPATPGTALADFVIFPPRWVVSEKTFRPPYFHRNVMSEFMINVTGKYDAKEGGFVPGGASLHNMNTPHGPDKESFKKEDQRKDDGPVKIQEGNLSVMFETSMQLVTTRWATDISGRCQKDYHKVWEGFENRWVTRKPLRYL